MYLFIWLQQVSVAACMIQFPDQGWNLGPLHWEHKVLAIGPPGKSPQIFLSCLQKNLHLHKHLYLDAMYLKYLLFKYEAVVFLQETVLPKTQKPRKRSPLEGSESNIFISKISDSKIYLLKSTLQKHIVLLYLKYPISLKKNNLNYDASKRGF